MVKTILQYGSGRHRFRTSHAFRVLSKMCYRLLSEKGVKMFHPSEQKISESGNEGGRPSMTFEDEIRRDVDDEEGSEICRTVLGTSTTN